MRISVQSFSASPCFREPPGVIHVESQKSNCSKPPSIDPNWALVGRYVGPFLNKERYLMSVWSLYIIHGGSSSHENAYAYAIFDPKDFLKFHYFGVYQIPKWKPIFQPNPSLFRVPWLKGDAQSGRSEAVVAWRPSWSLRPTSALSYGPSEENVHKWNNMIWRCLLEGGGTQSIDGINLPPIPKFNQIYMF